MKENNTYQHHSEGDNLPEYLRVNPFIVPAGYFDNLESNILSQIKLVHNLDIQPKTFQVPSGYFDDLQSRILSAVSMDQLLQSAQAENFTVPSQYFDTLQDNIASRIVEKELKDKVQADGFDIPNGYFDQLTQSVLANVALDQMTGGVVKDGFAVPATYFDKLSADLRKATVPKEEIATPVRRLNNINWIRYAAAACLVAILSVSAFFGLQESNESNQASETILSNISDDEIMNYLAATTNGDDMVYFTEYIYQPNDSEGVGKQIDKEDLEEYLNYTL